MRLKIPRNSRTPRRRIGMVKAAPPIQVRLTEDVGSLPTGFVYLLPTLIAHKLIAERKATAVGRYSGERKADMVLTEQECEEAGIA